MPHFADARARMVAGAIKAGLRDPHVIEAMRRVPRESFVPPALADLAYADTALPIGDRQTISQPSLVANMIQAAGVRPGHRVLEVGAGSGYAAALLGCITERVVAIERLVSLAGLARERMAALGLDHVEVRVGDGSMGCQEAAPFDAILVSAAAPGVPPALVGQLAPGGRLVLPVGAVRDGTQRLARLTRVGPANGLQSWVEDDLGPVSFVPLVGEQGWR